MRSLKSNDNIISFSIGFIIDSKKLIGWGTGELFKKLNAVCKLPFTYLVDNDKSKWGTEAEGYSVLPPDEIKKDKDNALILVMSMYEDEINAQILSYGIKQDMIFSALHADGMYLSSKMERFIRVKQVREEGINHIDIFRMYKKNTEQVMYRGISIGRVMARHFHLLLDYLFSESDLVILPSPPELSEYEYSNSGDILIPYLDANRNDRMERLENLVKDIPKERINRLYCNRSQILNNENNNELDRSKRDFIYDKSKMVDSGILELVQKSLKKLPVRLSEYEISWVINWINYYLAAIDFFYDLTEELLVSVLIADFQWPGEKNILYQIFKLKGVKCYELQHGHYAKLNNDEDMYRMRIALPFVEYGLASDILLCWGEEYKENFKSYGINDNDIKIIGNARYNYTLFEKRMYRKSKKHLVEKNIFALYTMGKGFYNEVIVNKKLIGFANALSNLTDTKYIVKLHPNTQWNDYKDKNTSNCIGVFKDEISMNELLSKVDFSICCASTVLIESIYHYIPSFNYIPENIFKIVKDDFPTNFSNEEELLQKFRYYSEDGNYGELLEDMEKLSEEYFSTSDLKPSERFRDYIYTELDKKC